MNFKHLILLTAVLLAPLAVLHAADSTDLFTPYLDGQAREILRELASTHRTPENITVRRVVFRSRDDSEIFALIATPKTTGKHPGMLVLHGGGGSAAVDQAMAWAQRGYVAVAPDMPGIADPKKLTETKGKRSEFRCLAPHRADTASCRHPADFMSVVKRLLHYFAAVGCERGGSAKSDFHRAEPTGGSRGPRHRVFPQCHWALQNQPLMGDSKTAEV